MTLTCWVGKWGLGDGLGDKSSSSTPESWSLAHTAAATWELWTQESCDSNTRSRRRNTRLLPQFFNLKKNHMEFIFLFCSRLKSNSAYVALMKSTLFSNKLTLLHRTLILNYNRKTRHLKCAFCVNQIWNLNDRFNPRVWCVDENRLQPVLITLECLLIELMSFNLKPGKTR